MKMQNDKDQDIYDRFVRLPQIVKDTADECLKAAEAPLSNGDRLVTIYDITSLRTIATMIVGKDDPELEKDHDFQYFFKINMMSYALSSVPQLNNAIEIAAIAAYREMTDDEFEGLLPDWFHEAKRVALAAQTQEAKSIEVQPLFPTNEDGKTVQEFHHSKIREAFGDIFPMPPGSSFVFIGPNFQKVSNDGNGVMNGFKWNIQVTAADLVTTGTEFEQWLLVTIAESRSKRTGVPWTIHGLVGEMDLSSIGVNVTQPPAATTYRYKFDVFFQLKSSDDWEVYTFYVGD